MIGRFLVRKMSCVKSFIDIGANLTDPMYQGHYNNSRKHDPDFDQVLVRARSSGVQKIIVTVGSRQDISPALELCRRHPDFLSCTVGIHPTRASEFEENDSPEELLRHLEATALENPGIVVAIGECGLDFDRTKFCAKEIQIK
ncbi:unnamed protein product [Cyprideis torosa]|uniref:Deoxyribonuclease TATDN1 n=1 Tax=Cyprideis torosa TaxID=163714 RepID=A0A7R8ZVR2_9CRUS|nr:unnamed protein product [Cyprideis torosa]CAG0903855.1 unnamed protein product [Cyprideis torosa]